MAVSKYPPFVATTGIGALQAALDAVPDGWAKLNGEWVQITEAGGHFSCDYGDDCADGRHYVEGEWRSYGRLERCWVRWR